LNKTGTTSKSYLPLPPQKKLSLSSQTCSTDHEMVICTYTHLVLKTGTSY